MTDFFCSSCGTLYLCRDKKSEPHNPMGSGKREVCYEKVFILYIFYINEEL